MSSAWHSVAKIAACCAYFSFGLFDSFYVSCQLDFVQQTNSTPAVVAAIVSLNMVSYCMGCLVFGWISDRTDNLTVVTACLLVCSIFNILVTTSASVIQLATSMSVLGLFSAGIDVSSNTWMLQLGDRNTGSLMQVMHFFCSVSAIVAPILASPFLSSRDHESKISIPAVLVSSSSLFPLVLIIVLKLWGNHELLPDREMLRQDDESVLEPERDQERNHSIQMRILGCVMFGLYGQIETIGFVYIFQFAVFSDVHMSKESASYLMSVANTVYAIGRLMSIGVATQVSSKKIVAIYFSIITIGLLIEISLASHSLVALWFSYVLVNLAQGGCNPAILTFLSEVVHVSNSSTGWFLFASRLMSAPGSLLVGSLVEDHPIVFPVYLLVTFTASALMFSILCCKTRQGTTP